MTSTEKQAPNWAAVAVSIVGVLWLMGSAAFGNAYAPRTEYEATKTKVDEQAKQLDRIEKQLDDIHKVLIKER